MIRTVPQARDRAASSDLLTVIAIPLLAYVVAVTLHELAGHGLACAALGGRSTELGAFYADCDYTGMTDLGIRLVALAGPLMSLITGVLALIAARRLPATAPHARYAAWLLGTIGLFTATGYLLFSGVSGLGDFGASRDGMIYQLQPEWLWRVGLAVAGLATYVLSASVSLRVIGPWLGGGGVERISRARGLALTSYLAGALMSVIVGLLNPHGLVIVLISAAASSLGGTSGLLWMMQMLNRGDQTDAPPLRLERRWSWVVAGALITAVYALILGPTVRP